MAIDLSKIFKANVKAIRMNSADSVNGPTKGEILNEQLLKTGKNKSKKQSKDTFLKEAKNIVNHILIHFNLISIDLIDYKTHQVANITILRKFLNENKKFYIQPK